MSLLYACLPVLLTCSGLNCLAVVTPYTTYLSVSGARLVDHLQQNVKANQKTPTISPTFIAICNEPRQIPADTVYVESWKRGEARIQEQIIIVEFILDQRNYEAIINSKTGSTKYLLKVDFELAGQSSSRVELYKISLYEIAGVSNSAKRISSYNLLMQEQPSRGKDYFPKEDTVGHFYPLEEISFFKQGLMGYSISAKRVIKVEGFYCYMQALKYKIGIGRPGTFDSLTLQIEFRNKQ